mgnify:CR=1 FL=1
MNETIGPIIGVVIVAISMMTMAGYLFLKLASRIWRKLAWQKTADENFKFQDRYNNNAKTKRGCLYGTFIGLGLLIAGMTIITWFLVKSI